MCFYCKLHHQERAKIHGVPRPGPSTGNEDFCRTNLGRWRHLKKSSGRIYFFSRKIRGKDFLTTNFFLRQIFPKTRHITTRNPLIYLFFLLQCANPRLDDEVDVIKSNEDSLYLRMQLLKLKIILQAVRNKRMKKRRRRHRIRSLRRD